jgi:hypothetical protein
LIEGFKFSKPLIPVDGTFLTGKYHGTLLVAVAQKQAKIMAAATYPIG